MKYLRVLLLPFFILALNACGDVSSSDDDDDDDVVDDTFETLDASEDYDILTALTGIPGVARSRSGSGTDDVGGIWTYDGNFTTLTAIDPDDPCLSGETQRDYSTTLTETVSGLVITTAGPACYSTSDTLQSTFSLDTSRNPEAYTLLTTTGDLPLLARIGDGGFFGSWNFYEDTDDNGVFDAATTDSFTGSQSANWNLEEREGVAALVLSYETLDEFGAVDTTETLTYFITPSGDVTGWESQTLIVGYGTITLSGTVD
jgi:hypothetical protein